jgi:hypothetical protein
MGLPDCHWALHRYIPDDDPAIRIRGYQLPVSPDEAERMDCCCVTSEDVGWLCWWSCGRF